MQTSITAAIAAFACNNAPPPETARAVARLSLMDWAAVSIAGLDEPVARILRETVAEEGGTAQAVVFGLAQKVPARAAALANGTLSHALDYDDTHFAYVGHPSVAVFPAALAMAERVDASAADCVDAALKGMEAASRIGHWLGTPHYNHGFHHTATSGTFGATVAAGRLLGLGPQQMCHALGIAATRASGLKSQFGTMGKPFNAGIAASNGVEAALLAAKGFVSRTDGIECGQGFAETHAGECRDLAGALAGLGTDYWFEAVQHKFHACCHGLHAALDALALVRAEEGFSAQAVTRVAITINPRWLRVCDIKSPSTGLEAKFSYRLTAAMALAGWPTAALTTFSDAACADPQLLRLRDLVDVVADPGISDTAARVRVDAGQTWDASVDLDAPMPFVLRQERLHEKIGSLLTPNAAAIMRGFGEAVPTMPARALAGQLAALSTM